MKIPVQNRPITEADYKIIEDFKNELTIAINKLFDKYQKRQQTLKDIERIGFVAAFKKLTKHISNDSEIGGNIMPGIGSLIGAAVGLLIGGGVLTKNAIQIERMLRKLKHANAVIDGIKSSNLVNPPQLNELAEETAIQIVEAKQDKLLELKQAGNPSTQQKVSEFLARHSVAALKCYLKTNNLNEKDVNEISKIMSDGVSDLRSKKAESVLETVDKEKISLKKLAK